MRTCHWEIGFRRFVLCQHRLGKQPHGSWANELGMVMQGSSIHINTYARSLRTQNPQKYQEKYVIFSLIRMWVRKDLKACSDFDHVGGHYRF